MSRYHCSHCGASAYYDGRCGDGPVLTCGCDRVVQVPDRMGFASLPTTDAKPVKGPAPARGKCVEVPGAN